jgi:hypothetical protein
MKNLVLLLMTRLVIEIMGTLWFFLRPIFYLYLVWFGMKISALFQ